MTQPIWRGWDGRRLSWEHVAAAELRIDGVRFETLRGSTDNAREFAFSPSGCAELEFTLHAAADGSQLGAPWRVLHGTAATPGNDQWQGPAHAMRALPSPPAAQRDAGTASTAIIVPIYNSPQLVQRCIGAVLRYTHVPARLILIDDASPDPAVGELLARYADSPHVLVRRNAHNLGYTRSSNLGIELAGGDDVVLLNSDTEVGPRWLNELRAVAGADTSVGTVTAVSDNAGAFSVPELEQYCPIPERWTLPQTQRALLQHAGACLPELPTGNGFCMFIKRRLLERVGVLDAAAFPSGYGEENDLCQRAESAGFRHVIAGNVLVRHARSASFGDERRAALGAQGMAVLRARYPDYEDKVGATLFSFARRVLDYRVRRLYADRDHFYAALPPRPRVLLAGEAHQFGAALRTAYDCRALTAPAADAAALRELLLRRAVELVHVHGTHDTSTLRAAAAELGVALLDTSGDALLGAPQSILLPGARIAAHCAQLYDAAWRGSAAFAAPHDAGFA
jgi:GT2 family glycosyltransferase